MIITTIIVITTLITMIIMTIIIYIYLYTHIFWSCLIVVKFWRELVGNEGEILDILWLLAHQLPMFCGDSRFGSQFLVLHPSPAYSFGGCPVLLLRQEVPSPLGNLWSPVLLELTFDHEELRPRSCTLCPVGHMRPDTLWTLDSRWIRSCLRSPRTGLVGLVIDWEPPTRIWRFPPQ